MITFDNSVKIISGITERYPHILVATNLVNGRNGEIIIEVSEWASNNDFPIVLLATALSLSTGKLVLVKVVSDEGVAS